MERAQRSRAGHRSPITHLHALAPALVAFGLFVAAGCSDDQPAPADGGGDAGLHPDAHGDAAGLPDTGPEDTGLPDADGGVHPDADADGGVHPDADAGEPPADVGPRAIIILHTNDEHSQIVGAGPEVDDYPTPAPRTSTSVFGGVKRRARVFDELRTEALIEDVPVAVVSAGDSLMGTLFQLADVIGGGVPAIDYASASLLGYDVLTLGNHELDFGVGALATALASGTLNLSGPARVLALPVVTSNIRFAIDSAADDALAGLYAAEKTDGRPLCRFHIQTFGEGAKAVRVGFFGLVGADAALVAPFKTPLHFSLPTTTTPCAHDAECPGTVCLPPADDPTAATGHCAASTAEQDPAVVFPALVADAAATVAELRSRGVDLVVALAHLGLDQGELDALAADGRGPEEAQRSESIALALGVEQALAGANLAGIDLVISGHSHARLQRPIRVPSPVSAHQTVIAEAGSHGIFVGKVKLTQPAPGAPWSLDEASSRLVPVSAAYSPNGLLGPLDAELDGLIGGVIAGLEGTPLATAGDGAIAEGEECDGAALPNGGLCAGLVPDATGGPLTCHANRQLDLSSCSFGQRPSCGDGALDPGEACDGGDLGGATCDALGYGAGPLACAANCTLDTAGCAGRFPSLLESLASFHRETPVRDDPSRVGDLFYAPLGHTRFDLPTPAASHESNLLDLVMDAERYTLNTVVPRCIADPVRVVVNASGVLGNDLKMGVTGALSLEDLFRVIPLGASPVEGTPGFSVVDYWLTAKELRQDLEIGVREGLYLNDFWLSVSGARVEYDPSRPPYDPASPATTGRITRIQLAPPGPLAPWDETADDTLFDVALGAGDAAYPSPDRLIHIATSFYVNLFAEALGECPRDASGAPFAECRPCTNDQECTAAAPTCDLGAQRCTGGLPVSFRARSLARDRPLTEPREVKELQALLFYVASEPTLPDVYGAPLPRRYCCVGPACTADRVCR